MNQSYSMIPFIDEEVWWSDTMGLHFRQSWRVKRILHREQSPYQSISILELEEIGRVLSLDGALQSAEKYEYFYHEQLIHPALHLCPQDNPSVLILGGGDGGSARECLKYPHVKKVTMVEIDRRVVELTQHYMPTLWTLPNGQRVSEDTRFSLVIQDGFTWIDENKVQGQLPYDVVIVDVSDPTGPSLKLFGKDFYRMLRACLAPSALVVIQSECPIYGKEQFQAIYEAVHAAFPDAKPYWGCVPTYPGGFWAYTMAGVEDPGLEDETHLRALMHQHKKFREMGVPFQFYDPYWHRQAFRWRF